MYCAFRQSACFAICQLNRRTALLASLRRRLLNAAVACVQHHRYHPELFLRQGEDAMAHALSVALCNLKARTVWRR